MNRIDRSSDNWYDGADSEALSVPPEIYFDEPVASDAPRKYTDADLIRLLWSIFSLQTDEFRIVRYRVIMPQMSLEDIATAEGEVKSSTFKKIRRLCDAHPLYRKMFTNYRIEENEA